MLSTSDISILDKYSSLSKLVRVIAYCLRFNNNTSRETDKYGLIRIQRDETDKATVMIIKSVQVNAWREEILRMRNSRLLNTNSNILRLKPFINGDGLNRVGRRLKNSDTIDIFQKHEISLHGGPQIILTRIRLKYWPINGRNIARDIV